ncbi:MAG: DNA ligase-associated DEXH box helicase, partial [Pseudomonadota bacterium]
AMPVWRFPPPAQEIGRLMRSLALFPNRTHVISAYSLGKAQRLMAELRKAGWTDAILVHRSMAGICAVYERFGVPLGPLKSIEKGDGSLAGAIVFAPPSSVDDAWSKRLVDPVYVTASGWNRGGRRAGGVELPLTISDHSDWDALTRAIEETGASEVWIDHGPPAALAHWCESRGIAAKPVQ